MDENNQKAEKQANKKGANAKKFTKGFLQGFKDFITRGNVLDLAVGVVIGAAFTAIVNALVNGIILQFISLLTGNANFTDLVWNINTGKLDANGDAIITAIKYGDLIQAIINFIIIAFVIYLVVIVLIKRQVKKNFAAEEAAKQKAIEDEEVARLEEEQRKLNEAVISRDTQLLIEIRDYLKELGNK